MYNKAENSNVTIHNITVVIQLSEQEKQGWTMKQIADDLGVNKMRIYRTISRLNLKEAYKKGQTLYFDQAAKDAVENAIRPNTSQSVRTNPQSRQTKTTDTSANQLLVSLNDRVKAQQTQIETLTRLLDQSQRLQLVAEQRTQKVEKQVADLQQQIGSSTAVATLTKPSQIGERNLDPDYFDKEQTEANNQAANSQMGETPKVKLIPKPEKQAGGFFKHFWQKPLL